MSTHLRRYLIVSLLVASASANSLPAFSQNKSDVDRINRWFDDQSAKQKDRDKYWQNLKIGPIQKSGEMQKAGNIGKAGEIQVPQGWKAIKTATLPCQKRYTLCGDTLFEFDKATLTPQAVQTLQLLVPELKKQAEHPITVEGHTDAIGTDEYNQQLSMRRAERVKNWLLENKVFDPEQVKMQGFGKRRPVAPNNNGDGTDNPEGRQLNRRVEIIVNTCTAWTKPETNTATAEKTSPEVATTSANAGTEVASGDEAKTENNQGTAEDSKISTEGEQSK